ncbi:MAG: hypothetical protein ACYTGX_12750 [Planctomycetota bacterium]|jgi:hypothetical protein
MHYVKTLSLLALFAAVGCAPSSEPAKTTTEKPAAGADATPAKDGEAAKAETVVLTVDGMT